MSVQTRPPNLEFEIPKVDWRLVKIDERASVVKRTDFNFLCNAVELAIGVGDVLRTFDDDHLDLFDFGRLFLVIFADESTEQALKLRFAVEQN